MPGDGFEELRAVVLADPALQSRLLATSGRPAFVADVVRLAAERNLVLSADDVEAELAAARRRWLERWV